MSENIQGKEILPLLKQLNTTSLRLIPYLENNADFDGLITVSKWEIEDEGFMSRKLVVPAIEGLLRRGLIYRNCEGELFLNYANGSNNRYFNINFESTFNQAIKSMHKRRILLLYSFLFEEDFKEWHPVDIEDLYRNSRESCLVGSLNDLLSNIIQLITTGLIEVKLGNQIVLTDAVSNLKELVLNYYREGIISEKNRFPMHICINPKILKNPAEINALRFNVAMKEFNIIAAEYHCSIDIFTEDLQTDIYNVKHKIFCKHGNFGMSVYRASLRAFFEEYEWKFEVLVKRKQFTKIFKDQFFVPHIAAQAINNE